MIISYITKCIINHITYGNINMSTYTNESSTKNTNLICYCLKFIKYLVNTKYKNYYQLSINHFIISISIIIKILDVYAYT